MWTIAGGILLALAILLAPILLWGLFLRCAMACGEAWRAWRGVKF